MKRFNAAALAVFVLLVFVAAYIENRLAEIPAALAAGAANAPATADWPYFGGDIGGQRY